MKRMKNSISFSNVLFYFKTCENKKQTKTKMIIKVSENSQNSMDSMDLDELKECLLVHICNENKAFFKSQQKDEPELEYEEKRQIASNLLNRSHLKFLQRFGFNMLKEHLRYFECNRVDDNESEEVEDYLKSIKHAIEHQGTAVKNRRYAAMVKLIEEGKYFSENEMKSRDPLLYEQLIGQYQSSAEKRANLRPNAETDTLVDVLLQGIDRQHDNEIEKQQREEEGTSQNEIVDENSNDSESSDSHSIQWGNFDDENVKKDVRNSRKRTANLITAGERDLLKEEFFGIMYSNFLSGKDEEFFDYSKVDENEEYDNVQENDQDEEDRYFEESDESNGMNGMNISDKNNEESEDDLDIYMKHLENQIKNQQITFQEEFDDD